MTLYKKVEIGNARFTTVSMTALSHQVRMRYAYFSLNISSMILKSLNISSMILKSLNISSMILKFNVPEQNPFNPMVLYNLVSGIIQVYFFDQK